MRPTASTNTRARVPHSCLTMTQPLPFSSACVGHFHSSILLTFFASSDRVNQQHVVLLLQGPLGLVVMYEVVDGVEFFNGTIANLWKMGIFWGHFASRTFVLSVGSGLKMCRVLVLINSVTGNHYITSNRVPETSTTRACWCPQSRHVRTLCRLLLCGLMCDPTAVTCLVLPSTCGPIK